MLLHLLLAITAAVRCCALRWTYAPMMSTAVRRSCTGNGLAKPMACVTLMSTKQEHLEDASPSALCVNSTATAENASAEAPPSSPAPSAEVPSSSPAPESLPGLTAFKTLEDMERYNLTSDLVAKIAETMHKHLGDVDLQRRGCQLLHLQRRGCQLLHRYIRDTPPPQPERRVLAETVLHAMRKYPSDMWLQTHACRAVLWLARPPTRDLLDELGALHVPQAVAGALRAHATHNAVVVLTACQAAKQLVMIGSGDTASFHAGNARALRTAGAEQAIREARECFSEYRGVQNAGFDALMCMDAAAGERDQAGTM
ncbi:hypothetical protein JKP88DRAFT_320158 [Tribonema minus]|uniref:Uncharacterized protein n=1 Tax=Tribonema minus TaxID=303371 RepID=A0A836CE94_9STRA|nr:hypothetical protein JKP88DRAFT_320158 [Tribonema minus]